MKLKQALVLGLTTAVLAIPAFAADEAMNATSQPSSVTTEQKAEVITPAKKEAFHKKGQKDNSEVKKTDQDTVINKLNSVNPSETEAK